MANSHRHRKNSDDDIYWDENIPATHNELMKKKEAQRPNRSEVEKQREWDDQRRTVLHQMSRQAGFAYLVIDIEKLINSYCGISFQWRWSLKNISGALALYDGARKVVCCAGPSFHSIQGHDVIFGPNSSSIEEMITLRVHQCFSSMKIGIYSKSSRRYFWFEGIQKAGKIDTNGMSDMKKDLFANIFGHLPSQQTNTKIVSPVRAGDTIVFRLWRSNKFARECTIERKYNFGNWQTMDSVSCPCVGAVSLYSIGDSVSFIKN